METATLDDFMSWNDQLAAAIDAGVPLDFGLGEGTEDTTLVLEKINALIARRTSQGSSLAAAMQTADPTVPHAYRSLMQLSLWSGTPMASFSLANRLAQNVDQAWEIGRLALFYPVLVCCVAFVGIVGFCLYFVPVLEGTYDSLDIKAGAGLHILASLRHAMPYWAVAFPLGLAFSILWVRRRSKPLDELRRQRLLQWVPGISRAIFQERAANFADVMAMLLERGVPFAEALKIAAGIWKDRSLEQLTIAFAARAEHANAATEGGVLASRLPPFLRWALLHSGETTGRVGALRIAASFYHRSAVQVKDQLRIVLPLVVALLIGGVATLLYGLALFVPVIEMLRGLASQYST